ncbi:hypothetical protein [Marinivivus vitaminiproducens]|uniref:hypothetical protein n=1 Tax=Marinivivus vitaminiproducens TaxID=3035935 RepID=UPI00279AC023|nr:hypothetical protein P4R82_11800 [Geminicoccaceae bacterium SCSIO 64248]
MSGKDVDKTTLDISQPASGKGYDVKISPEESLGERRVRLFKDVVMFLVAVGFAVLIVSLCYATLTSPDTSADEKKWAMSVLSAATGGIIGYLIRR